MPLSSLSKRTRLLATCFLTIPWAVITIVWFGLLPQGWRFERWSAPLQAISVVACVLFWVADALFAAWYFLALIVDAYGSKSNGSA